MNELPVAEIAAIPCPQCDYDLRGQSTARCPECGSDFESFEAMIRASQSAKRIFNLAMMWRQRLAYFTFFSLALIIVSIFASEVGRFMPRFIMPVVLCLWPLSGLLAMILMIQVIRWRFSRMIPQHQRVELSSSIPWLLFLSAPFIITVVIVLATAARLI